VSDRAGFGATYRLQLSGLGFAAATDVVPFLHALGVETCYLSPIARARSGSSHGYDVVDPNALDSALGSVADFDRLLAALADHRMSVLVDIVPNHMAASVESPMFADVLHRGRESAFAPWFDIHWDDSGGAIVLPVLDRPLADLLAAGEITVGVDDSSSDAYIHLNAQRYPVAAGSISADDVEALMQPGADQRAARTKLLATILARQHYRFVEWRRAGAEVNYRRFFDISDLLAVRQEDPQVFADTHRLVAELAADPRIAGFRVDHVDGLQDPKGYLTRLHSLLRADGAEGVVLVEKILARSEPLPDWPVTGTTGYEFADLLLGIFMDERGTTRLATAAASTTGDHRSFAERSVEAKRAVVDALFPRELARVVGLFAAAIGPEVGGNDGSVRRAVRELTAMLAVYRTYRQPEQPATAEEVARVEAAAKLARTALPTAAASDLLDRLTGVILGEIDPAGPACPAIRAWQQLTGPVAAKGVEDTAMYNPGQLIAAADVGTDPDRPAVSVEAFHAAMTDRVARWPGALSSTSTHDSKRSHDMRCRLAVLSEIAAEWDRVIHTLDRRAGLTDDTDWPDSADRRYAYETLVGSWPLPHESGPGYAARVGEHLVKAAREGKRHSSWLEPHLAYEAAFVDLARRIIGGDLAECRQLIETTVATVERTGVVNSLASVVLKVAAPGVPDTYWGDDLWWYALTDPDNRRALSFAEHAATLSGLPGPDEIDHDGRVAALLEHWRDGAVKQYVVRQSLHARRAASDLFRSGDYQPLTVSGERADHVVALERRHGERSVIAVVPRTTYQLTGPDRFPIGSPTWGDDSINLASRDSRAFVDAFTGRTIDAADGHLAVAAVFATLPVALLVAAPH
jgi:malto-oligosyltrehalose synthase